MEAQRYPVDVGENIGSRFLLLYMVLGMQHCLGGPGATMFGQEEDEPLTKSNTIFRTLQRWVEARKTPATITATKFVHDERSQGLEITRPLCPYPLVPKYVKGDRR
jgi:feruloyl esterase